MNWIATMMTAVLVVTAYGAENNRAKYRVGMTVDEVKAVMTMSPPPLTTHPSKIPKGMESLNPPPASYVDVPGDRVRLIFGATRTVLRVDDLDQEGSDQREQNSTPDRAPQSGVDVIRDNENVVASRLIGKWKTDAALTERLQGTAGRDETLVFVEDKSVTAKLPDRYVNAFRQKPLYLAGTMTRNGKEHPFILTEHHGNPYVFYFRGKNGDPMGDGEAFNLVIAPAKDKMKDMLLIGGDFNNQPFVAFGRQKQE